jgi:penicillin amidase
MLKQWFFIFLLFMLIIFAGFTIFFYVQFNKLKPQYKGELHVSEINDTVSIKRDSSGVIYIEGQNIEDVILASGFATAQDRLWQMEMLRLLGKGELSSLFGIETLEVDKLFCTLEIDSLTHKLCRQISQESMLWLEQYAKGINLYIENYRDKLPIEFTLMRWEPEYWSSQDCLLQNRIMAWLLNFNWKADLLFWYLSSTLTSNHLKDILPKWRKRADIINSKEMANLIEKINNLCHKITLITGITPSYYASNNWVVSPKLSQNGSAMLANDPHLPLQLPSIWIEMQMKTPDMNVAGFGLPGTPGIIIGRNEKIAWGVTNGMIDDSDYFIEKIDTVKKKYLVDTLEKDLIVRNNQIMIRDQNLIFYNSFKTKNGPIFNKIFPELKLSHSISLKWTGWEFSDESQTFIKLAKASNWQEFNEALTYFTLPSQNFVYADIDGNIGYSLAGKVPIRSYKSGLFPVSGFNSKNQWLNWLPLEKMPKIYNPESGYIITANNNIGKNLTYYLSELWEPPYRAMRIHQLIGNSSTFNMADFVAVQTDNTNLLAREILPMILGELKVYNRMNEAENKIFFLLENWNFRTDITSIAAGFYEVLQYYLIINIFKDEMGEDAFNLFTDLPNFYLRIFENVFLNRNSIWFDDIRTKSLEKRSDIIIKSVENTFTYFRENVSENIEDWYWGALHHLELKHVFGKDKITGRIFNRGPYSVPGSGTTINVATYKFSNPFDMIAGPSLRFIVDWNEPDLYHSVIPGGNSGNIFSSFYDNQINSWQEGSLKQISMKAGFFLHDFLLVPNE